MPSGCRWSANSRSRMRWSPPALRSAPAARRTGVSPRSNISKAPRAGWSRSASATARRSSSTTRTSPMRWRRRCRRCGPMRDASLVVVFGAGGDRDAGKRPLMGAIAAENADQRHRHRRQSAQRKSRPDPRRDPEPPRTAPARSATAPRRSGPRLPACRQGDALLIAGKGHETGQIVGDRVLPFSDHDAVASALAPRVA